MSKGRIVVFAAGLVAAVGVQAQIYSGPPKPGSPLVSYTISQGFGVDWSRNSAQAHTGIDLATPKGNRVFAVKDGVVYRIGNLGGDDGGYAVVFNRDGTSSGYLHMNVSVSKDQTIKRGQVLGTVYKDHLHLNQCKQADGCQHGAFPNPTFPNQPKSNVTKYYVRPSL